MEPNNILVYKHGPLFFLVIEFTATASLLASIGILLAAFGRHDASYRNQFILAPGARLLPDLRIGRVRLRFQPLPDQDPALIAFHHCHQTTLRAYLRQGCRPWCPSHRSPCSRTSMTPCSCLDAAATGGDGQRRARAVVGLDPNRPGGSATGGSLLAAAWPGLPHDGVPAVAADLPAVFIDHPTPRWPWVMCACVMVTDRARPAAVGRVSGAAGRQRALRLAGAGAAGCPRGSSPRSWPRSTLLRWRTGLRRARRYGIPLTGLLYRPAHLEDLSGRESCTRAAPQNFCTPPRLVAIGLDQLPDGSTMSTGQRRWRDQVPRMVRRALPRPELRPGRR